MFRLRYRSASEASLGHRSIAELLFDIFGASRDRTDDPLLARQVLSQLSYDPETENELVGLGRLELPTSPLSGVRSNQLSYRPCSENYY